MFVCRAAREVWLSQFMRVEMFEVTGVHAAHICLPGGERKIDIRRLETAICVFGIRCLTLNACGSVWERELHHNYGVKEVIRTQKEKLSCALRTASHDRQWKKVTDAHYYYLCFDFTIIIDNIQKRRGKKYRIQFAERIAEIRSYSMWKTVPFSLKSSCQPFYDEIENQLCFRMLALLFELLTSKVLARCRFYWCAIDSSSFCMCIWQLVSLDRCETISIVSKKSWRRKKATWRT